MENVVPEKIQIITIIISLCFVAYIARLIIKGKLREEYSFIWLIGTVFLILFSFWRSGLEIMAKLLGVEAAPNLVFTAAIFVILIYLLHLSVVVSKLHSNNRELAQKLSMLSQKMEKLEQKEAASKDEKPADK